MKITRIVIACGVMTLFVVLMALALRPGPLVRAQDTRQDIIKVPDDHATIQAAINVATDGDTIQVAQGTYTENLIITESITLEGGWRSDWLARDPEVYVTTVDGNKAGRVIYISGSCTPTVDGFVVTGGKTSLENGAAIYCTQAHPIIQNNVIWGNATNASGHGVILLDYGSGAVISGNVICNNGNLWSKSSSGIQTRYHNNAVIQANRVYRNGGMGIGINYCANPVVQANEIYSNTWMGLYLNHCSQATVSGNVIYSSTPGVMVDYCTTPTLRGNAIHHNHSWSEAGGGIYIGDSPQALILNNEVHHNQARYGGGLFIHRSDSATVYSNTFYLNWTTDGDGGGLRWIRGDQGTLAHNKIYSNTAGHDGGGGYIYAYELEAITISHNLIQGNTAAYAGGGLRVDGHPNAIISGNVVYSNSARDGGGLVLAGVASLTVVNNMVARNDATQGVDGIELYGQSFLPLQGTLVNNTIVDNDPGVGRGIYVLSPYVTVTLKNNIIAGHAMGIQVDTGAKALLDYTLWHHNDTPITGTGTVTNDHPVYGDPCFVDPTGKDYHIQADSAARDAGDPMGVPPAPPTDIDGDTRPQGSRVDIGADEYVVPVYPYHLFLPLVLKGY